jgi:hypothetical protein
MFFAGTGQAAALLRAPGWERIASAVCSGETWWVPRLTAFAMAATFSSRASEAD